MGKKIEKALKEKGQASASSQEHEDDPNKPPEPYVCSGNFAADFTELCKRGNIPVVIPVVPRPRRPSSPPSAPVEEVKSKPGKGGDKKGKQVVEAPPEVEPEKEVDPNAEPAEPPPKTYILKDKFEYFRPCIQVEQDHPDKGETVTDIYIRGWRLEDRIFSILKECWCKMDKLTTLSLWNTGLDANKIEFLAQMLPSISSLRNLILDNNVVGDQNYHILIRDESPLTSLSLRYNEITDVGATNLARVLGTLHHQNTRLTSLNLNGNRITDKGAICLSEGLRMNRTLLVLNLANNQIGDEGVEALAAVLSRFSLSHEETVERRKMVFDRGHTDRKSVSPPPGSRRADSRDRPGSVRSIQNLGATAKGKSAKTKKEGTKGKEKEEEKTPKGGKGAKEAPDPKGSKKASLVTETTKTKGKEKTKGTKGKAASQPEAEQGVTTESSEDAETSNPLMENAERTDDGKLYLVGNRALLCLNLAHNKITEKGLEALHLAVCYQTTMAEFSPPKPCTQGLMRLLVTKNNMPADSEIYRKLMSLMVTKDPFYKPPATTPDIDSQSRNSKQP